MHQRKECMPLHESRWNAVIRGCVALHRNMHRGMLRLFKVTVTCISSTFKKKVLPHNSVHFVIYSCRKEGVSTFLHCRSCKILVEYFSFLWWILVKHTCTWFAPKMLIQLCFSNFLSLIYFTFLVVLLGNYIFCNSIYFKNRNVNFTVCWIIWFSVNIMTLQKFVSCQTGIVQVLNRN